MLSKNRDFPTNLKSCISYFSNFPCIFLNRIFFSNLNSNCSNLLYLKNLQDQVKKHSVTKNCSGLSLSKQIVLLISKILQILHLQSRISKIVLDHFNNFFPTVGQIDFGNKIPFRLKFWLLEQFFLNHSSLNQDLYLPAKKQETWCKL